MSAYSEGYRDGLKEAELIARGVRDGFRDELRREGPWAGDPEPDEQQARDLERCMWGAETVAWAIRTAYTAPDEVRIERKTEDEA